MSVSLFPIFLFSCSLFSPQQTFVEYFISSALDYSTESIPNFDNSYEISQEVSLYAFIVMTNNPYLKVN